MYDTNDQTVEDFLADPAIMDMVLEGSVAEGRGPYLAALDAHANFKENEAARTEEEVALAAATTSALLDEYNQAVAEGDILAANAVEQTAKTKLDPAEWSIAKRDNVAPKKGKKPSTKAKGLGEGTTSDKPKDATPTPEVTNPYRAGTNKAAAYEEAVEALGDVDAYPEITKSIDSKKGVYGEGETPFQRVLAKAKLKKRLADLSDVEQSQEGDTKAETAASTDNLAKKLASAVASGDIELTNTQVKVLDVVLDAIENDNLGDYFYGDGKTGSAKLAEAAGLKGRSTADSAIKSIRKYFTDAAGEGTKDQLKNTQYRGVGGFSIHEVAGHLGLDNGEAPGSEGAVSAINTAVNAPENTNVDYTGEPTDDTDTTDGYEAASNLEHAFGTGGVGIIKSAGGSHGNISALTKEENAWVDKHAEATAKKEHSARMSKARKEREAFVSRITSNKELTEQLSDTWDENKPENAGSFGDMSTNAKASWINAVAESMQTGNVGILRADASEINEKFSGKQDKGVTANDKMDREPKTKTEEVLQGRREDNKKPAGDGAAANKRGEKGTETLRKGKPKVTYKSTTKKPKVTVKKPQKPKRSDAGASKAAQKAMDYADEKLGDNWPTDYPVLMRILASKKFAAFTKKVDGINLFANSSALHYNKTKESVSFESKHGGLLSMISNSKKKKAFDKILSILFGDNIPKHVMEHFHIVDTVEDLRALFPNGDFSDNVGGVYTRRGSQEDVVFVLEGIKEGDEMSLFMHEVAGHLGLDNLLSMVDVGYLVDKIKGWADGEPTMPLRKDGSLHPRDPASIARIAVDRANMAAAQSMIAGTPFTPSDLRSETIAYFLQAAIDAGVKPTATKAKGTIGEIVSLIMRSYESNS